MEARRLRDPGKARPCHDQINALMTCGAPGHCARPGQGCGSIPCQAGVANRADDDLVDALAEQGIAYVPYFPLGGLQSGTLDTAAARLGTSPLAVALAWLLHRSPNILLIPGTSAVDHLRANVAAADLSLSGDALDELNAL